MGARAKKSSSGNIKEIIKTPKGKGLAAGLVLVLLILVIMMVMTFAFPVSNNSPAPTSNDLTEKKTSPSTVAKTESSQTVTSDTAETDLVVGADLSNYNDPFKPLDVVVTTAAAVGQNNTATATSSSENSVDVLSLQSINDQGGEKYATVLYGGQQYVVKTGDQIDSSPFYVEDIGTSNITLIYGDSRLSLQIGDTIVK
ncbi:MAG: hypothetical protein K6T91_04020 [Firmicutes bacterium]|nr:hypothetical protein [Bacillota bacterium]